MREPAVEWGAGGDRAPGSALAGVDVITPADPRVAALHVWLDAWWRRADEEERAWMVVEMGELRHRWLLRETPPGRRGGGSRQTAAGGAKDEDDDDA